MESDEMTTSGRHTGTEILSQPEVWLDILATIRPLVPRLLQFKQDGGYQTVLFTGCGSTYYLALAAATLLQEVAGIPARGIPASEIWLNPGAAYPGGARSLLVAVSRSGETTETLRACESFLQRGQGDLLTLSCYAERPLASMGQINLLFPSAQEQSVAQTRAFSSLYLATVALAAIWGGRTDLLDELERLPLLAGLLLKQAAPLADCLGRDLNLDRFYFLGSGARYGLACELSLKMKEMSLSHSEPFHFMEFRHGPQSMVDEHTLIVGLLSQANLAYERQVLAEMRARQARVLEMGEIGQDIAFHSGLSEATMNALFLPAGQLLAFERSLAKSLDPDRPHNLNAVVHLP
jgi:glucosamine--fructose-6-phosphate aminotransferase (isomerizing)